MVLASFGDASANHSTAQGAFNTAAWAAYQGTPMPIVFLCEDNGIGISTSTPTGWIEASSATVPGCIMSRATAAICVDAMRGAREAVEMRAGKRKPVFLHMRRCGFTAMPGRMCRVYLSKERIARDEERDPLLAPPR